MEITSKYHKTDTICNWKYKGVLYDDFDDLYETYIKTMNCSHCGKEFPNTRDRCLDHCHETGQFRAIVCKKCNTRDNYLKHPNGPPNKQQQQKIRDKKHYEKNKDKVLEKSRLKYTCECGITLRKDTKSRHEKTQKHINACNTAFGVEGCVPYLKPVVPHI